MNPLTIIGRLFRRVYRLGYHLVQISGEPAGTADGSPFPPPPPLTDTPWWNTTWIGKPYSTGGQYYGSWNFNESDLLEPQAWAILCMGQNDARYVMQGSAGAGVQTFNTRSGNVVLESDDVINALGYTPANGNATAGVLSWNSRTGAVTLQGSDVTGALGFVPPDSAEIARVGYSGMYDDLLNPPAPYVLPPATGGSLGGIMVGPGLTVSDTGLLSVNSPEPPDPYILPPATPTTLGGVIPGGNITVNENGVISVALPSPPTPYVLPTAAPGILGGIKVGSNLTIAPDGTLSATGGGGGANGTYLQAQNLTYPLNMNATWTGACTTSPAQSGYAFMGTSYQAAGNGNHSVLLTATGKAINMGSYVYINDYDPGDTEIRSWGQGGRFNQFNVGFTDTTLTYDANKTWSGNSVLSRAYADTRYVLTGGSFATIPISAQPFLNANVAYGQANMPTWTGYMVAGQNAVNKWNNPNSPPSVISSFSQNVVSGIAYSTNGNSPQMQPGQRNVLNYYTYNNQQGKWYSNWGDISVDPLKPTFSQRFEQYGTDETTIQGYAESCLTLGGGGSGVGSAQLISTQSTTTTGTPVPYTVGLSVSGSCSLKNNIYTSTSSITLLGTANLTWNGASVLSRDYADARYGLKASTLTGRPLFSGPVTLKDGSLLMIEDGRVVGLISPDDYADWMEETASLSSARVADFAAIESPEEDLETTVRTAEEIAAMEAPDGNNA